MSDLIALRCPSCGGNIQVDKKLEKMFCTNCGTQLLLKQGADGLLTPMLARQLNASAQLKETQNALMLAKLLKEQVGELEGQAGKVQAAFWAAALEGAVKNTVAGHLYAQTKTTRLINQYTRLATGKEQIDFKLSQLSNDNAFAVDKLMHSNLPGLSTPEELLRLYQFIIQPQYYDQTAYRLAQVLHPLTTIVPELMEKRARLQKTTASLGL